MIRRVRLQATRTKVEFALKDRAIGSTLKSEARAQRKGWSSSRWQAGSVIRKSLVSLIAGKGSLARAKLRSWLRIRWLLRMLLMRSKGNSCKETRLEKWAWPISTAWDNWSMAKLFTSQTSPTVLTDQTSWTMVPRWTLKEEGKTVPSGGIKARKSSRKRWAWRGSRLTKQCKAWTFSTMSTY